MGDPIRQKKKYSTPQHPWEAKRMEVETGLRKEFGLKSKKEIWKASTTLRRIKEQARKLISLENEQAKKEEKQLIDKLVKLGLVGSNAKIDDILGIDIRKLLERRLQTQVFKRKLSRSAKQARQFITHKHIMVGDNIVSKPSYLVDVSEEGKISFNALSGLSKVDHPERAVAKKEVSEVELTAKEKETIVSPKYLPCILILLSEPTHPLLDDSRYHHSYEYGNSCQHQDHRCGIR